jgi:hypothetical protein
MDGHYNRLFLRARYLSARAVCSLLTRKLLLFIATTADLRYINMIIILSACLHLDDTQCGIRALKGGNHQVAMVLQHPKLGNKNRQQHCRQRYIAPSLLSGPVPCSL